MVTLSEMAQKQVLTYFTEKEIVPVRLFLNNGCGGGQLAMAMDEVQADDAVYHFGDLTFVIQKALLAQATPIKIDAGPKGFIIESNLDLGAGCSGCGTSSNCCG